MTLYPTRTERSLVLVPSNIALKLTNARTGSTVRIAPAPRVRSVTRALGGNQCLRSQSRTPKPGARMEDTLQNTTTFSFDGYRITEYKGVVRGIVVRSPTLGQGFLGGLKQIVGGQIGAYAEMCEQARQQAYDRLLQHARERGANAIVGLRYESSEVGRGGSATEVLCYGTAVVIQRA